MELSETYINREHLWKIVNDYNITTYQASESSFASFLVWRNYYMKDFVDGKQLDKFDIESQVEMFNHDLNKLYEE